MSFTGQTLPFMNCFTFYLFFKQLLARQRSRDSQISLTELGTSNIYHAPVLCFPFSAAGDVKENRTFEIKE